MASHEEVVVKKVVTRAWSDLEPKVITFLTTGAILSAATYVASLLGFTLPDWAPAVIVWLGSTLAAYLKKSSVKVVTPSVPVASGVVTDTPSPVFDPISTPAPAPVATDVPPSA